LDKNTTTAVNSRGFGHSSKGGEKKGGITRHSKKKNDRFSRKGIASELVQRGKSLGQTKFQDGSGGGQDKNRDDCLDVRHQKATVLRAEALGKKNGRDSLGRLRENLSRLEEQDIKVGRSVRPSPPRCGGGRSKILGNA